MAGVTEKGANVVSGVVYLAVWSGWGVGAGDGFDAVVTTEADVGNTCCWCGDADAA